MRTVHFLVRVSSLVVLVISGCFAEDLMIERSPVVEEEPTVTEEDAEERRHRHDHIRSANEYLEKIRANRLQVSSGKAKVEKLVRQQPTDYALQRLFDNLVKEVGQADREMAGLIPLAEENQKRVASSKSHLRHRIMFSLMVLASASDCLTRTVDLSHQLAADESAIGISHLLCSGRNQRNLSSVACRTFDQGGPEEQVFLELFRCQEEIASLSLRILAAHHYRLKVRAMPLPSPLP